MTVVAAGTSDLPVAREAALTASYLGRDSELIVDVGVAGLHRILGHLELLRRSRVIIVVAGMDGALASVVAGLVRARRRGPDVRGLRCCLRGPRPIAIDGTHALRASRSSTLTTVTALGIGSPRSPGRYSRSVRLVGQIRHSRSVRRTAASNLPTHPFDLVAAFGDLRVLGVARNALMRWDRGPVIVACHRCGAGRGNTHALDHVAGSPATT